MEQCYIITLPMSNALPQAAYAELPKNHARWRMTARPANSPAIENTTEPST
jgi:hypothetical protein